MSSLRQRVIVTTVPFGQADRKPIDLFRDAGIELVINPIGRRLKASEVRAVIAGFPAVVAGTETIDAATLADCPDLKVICRVGVGLDGVDLLAARKLGIAVSYTPEAPAAAVAELAVGQMINLLRGVTVADIGMRRGQWTRVSGARLASSTVGVIGTGRIGRLVIQHLLGGFPGVKILAHDIKPNFDLAGVEWVEKEMLLRRSDVVTLHVPLTRKTADLIGAAELKMMKPAAVLVNTARGGIVNEAALVHALTSNEIRAAAIDVFQEEPYNGPLATIDTAVLSCHMGSMTADCRARMEIEATQEAIRFLTERSLQSPVPEEEYENAASFAHA